MTTATASMRRSLAALTALACLATAGCDGSYEAGNVVEVEGGEAGPQVDLEAYTEQRLANGAVTLIDAALPDGTLMPATHSGPTWGELEAARRERQRAAAEARADEDLADDEEEDEPDRSDTPAPRPASPPPPPAPPPPLALDVDTDVTQ